MVLLPTDEQEIKSLIMNLKNDCAVRVTLNFLKQLIEVIVPPFTFICNFASGFLTSAFKKPANSSRVQRWGQTLF